jgi:hypothetical protein
MTFLNICNPIKNDIILHDRTKFDENVAVVLSDYMTLAQSLLKLAEESGASKEALQKILNERTKLSSKEDMKIY